jgi:hypothetical protein
MNDSLQSLPTEGAIEREPACLHTLDGRSVTLSTTWRSNRVAFGAFSAIASAAMTATRGLSVSDIGLCRRNSATSAQPPRRYRPTLEPYDA